MFTLNRKSSGLSSLLFLNFGYSVRWLRSWKKLIATTSNDTGTYFPFSRQDKKHAQSCPTRQHSLITLWSKPPSCILYQFREGKLSPFASVVVLGLSWKQSRKSTYLCIMHYQTLSHFYWAFETSIGITLSEFFLLWTENGAEGSDQ